MRRSLVLLLLVCAPLARAANWPDRPTLQAVRATSPIVIDGDLSDAAWQSAPEFTDFTQHDPHDGEPPTMRTSLRIVFDDNAIYFGALMEDTARPTALLARRDTFVNSDFLSINIDSQHDRLSGAAFTVFPSGPVGDSILYNDIGEDGSWDAVWDSQTKILPNGWIAEVRLPFSQLRFPEKPSHVWGLNVTRRTVRNNEWVRIVNTKKGEAGFVSHFADVTGLDGIRRERQLEIVPYAVARSDVRTRFDRSNSLIDGQEQRFDGGLDLKYALTSTLTLTGTINPDFGQVEVDPAVVNLSQFETFYPEKRPFFTEGLNIFAFGDSPARTHINFLFPPQMFYSRRIGREPQTGVDAAFSTQPGETTILGAAKITGKMGNGWSVGVLDALTDVERATYLDDSLRLRKLQVEPMTNYFVSRVTKEYGPSRVGFLLTSVNRRMPDELSPLLRENALSAGVDGYTSFHDGSWILEWQAMGSRVSGSEEAIARTQLSSAHYYQRPDAGHVEFDPTRTSLNGTGGRVMLSKQTGLWRPIVQIHAYSPGFETNDVGFMQRADIMSGHAMMQYVNETPTKQFRSRTSWFGTWMNRNFDGDTLDRGVFSDNFGTFANYWDYRAALFVSGSAFSDQRTRGGPVVRLQPSWSSDLSLNSDSRKRFFFGVDAHVEDSEEGSYARSGGVSLNFRPATNLTFSVTPALSRSHEAHQYVTASDGRYVFSELEQRSFELSTRMDWTLNARLSLQLYVQPFIAAGDFHDAHALAAARTADYVPYALPFPDPDFNFRSVRGSAVARWEFRPGSALYVVWNENRADEEPLGDFRFRRDARAISTAPSHDVFLVKVSYWLPL
ncbi:MAG TPA: DUF5916 domain-containing protein [Thermoanaerobaculia bacterium]|nr:DUF5916 domain-containing protein [Thermoanaerobaculia bacterium]